MLGKFMFTRRYRKFITNDRYDTFAPFLSINCSSRNTRRTEDVFIYHAIRDNRPNRILKNIGKEKIY